MSSATPVAQEGWIGPDQRISTMTQLRGAFERIRKVGVPLATLGLATCATGLGGQLVAGRMGIPLTGVEATGPYLAYLVATTLVTSVLSAMGLRALVRGRDRWFKVDAPLLAGAAVLGALTLGFVGINLGFVQLTRSSPDPGQTLAWALLAMVGYAVVIYASLRLALWPIGIMMERPDVTPARSWRLMRKATRGLVLGNVVLGAPLVAVSIAGSGLLTADLAAGALGPMRILITVLGVAFAYGGSGLIATIYDLRVTGRSGVADVFD